jgi:hypothetical protein
MARNPFYIQPWICGLIRAGRLYPLPNNEGFTEFPKAPGGYETIGIC